MAVAQPRRGVSFLHADVHLTSQPTPTKILDEALGSQQMHTGIPLTRPLIYIAASILTCAAVGCGSTVATSTGPSPTKCAVTLAVPASPVGSDGSTATVGVTTQPECAWSASSDAAWITSLAPTSGQGSGQLQMQIAANPDAAVRQGDVVVNRERARIRQDAAPCRFELSTTEQTVPAAGGSGGITVTAASGCGWRAQADAGWVTLTAGTTGTGAGSVSFTVAANPGTTTRSASIVVAGQTLKVTQQANAAPPPPPTATDCSVTVTPKDVSFLASGTPSNSIAVTALSSCAWSASSGASWITLTGRTSGTGNGTVTFSIASNNGAARSGALTIGDQTVPISQAAGAVSCSYTVTPLTTSVAAAGGPGPQVSVDTQTGCAWTAASTATWVTITSGSSVSGDGAVAFTAAANTGNARTATLSVAGQTVTVSQPSTSCAVTATPPVFSIAAAGSSGTSVSVNASNGCAWTAASNVAWMTVAAGANGSGNGTVTFTVSANSGTARSGMLTIGGQIVTVNQLPAPCAYSVTPPTLSPGATGGAVGPVTVTTADGCAWAATSSASWLTITAGASGSGNGTVTVNAAANTGAARTATLTIASQSVTVSQTANQCAYSVTPTTVPIAAVGGSGAPISVSTGPGCTWSASSAASWVSILTGASATGPGTVTYTVLPNTGSARTGTLTVAGQPVSISQSAPCVYTLSRTSDNFEKSGGTDGRVSVMTQSGCAWTAGSNADWITVTSGTNGSGNGTVAYSVAANNTGSNRTGTLTIAGQTFTVTQKK
jgi:hypothetical protein